MIDPETGYDYLCDCPPEHSITKLGHCATCPHGANRMLALAEEILATHTGGPREITVFICLPDCVHDFSYATYSDASKMTGVCRCGVREIDYALLAGP